METGDIYQFSENNTASPRYKIVFDTNVEAGNTHWRDLLGGWLAVVENAPEIGAQTKNVLLTALSIEPLRMSAAPQRWNSSSC